jgi:GntR family transcriptional regulator
MSKIAAERLKENPPFQRLQTELATFIGSLSHGDRLPAEPELAKQLGVSRATLREAMRTFEGQGIIRRRQGIGTFVVGKPQILDSGLSVLQSVETLARKIDLEVSMGELMVMTIEANEEQAQLLGITVGDELLHVERVILAEDRPVAFLVDILPRNILSAEELGDGFTGSVLDFLLKRGQPSLFNSKTDICAVAAPSEIAKALEIQRGDVLLKFKGLLFSDHGEAVDLSTSYFLPGYFHFHIVRRVED